MTIARLARAAAAETAATFISDTYATGKTDLTFTTVSEGFVAPSPSPPPVYDFSEDYSYDAEASPSPVAGRMLDAVASPSPDPFDATGIEMVDQIGDMSGSSSEGMQCDMHAYKLKKVSEGVRHSMHGTRSTHGTLGTCDTHAVRTSTLTRTHELTLSARPATVF